MPTPVIKMGASMVRLKATTIQPSDAGRKLARTNDAPMTPFAAWARARAWHRRNEGLVRRSQERVGITCQVTENGDPEHHGDAGAYGAPGVAAVRSALSSGGRLTQTAVRRRSVGRRLYNRPVRRHPSPSPAGAAAPRALADRRRPRDGGRGR